MLDARIASAVDVCVARRIPFVCYQLPCSDNVAFFADNMLRGIASVGVDVSGMSFFANDFHKSLGAPLVIRPLLGVDDVLGYDGTVPDFSLTPSPWRYDTVREEYRNGLCRLIARLEKSGSKTVISRVLTGDAVSVRWSDVCGTYFDGFGGCFRYCFYHPLAGCWIGATPELLLDCDMRSGDLATMSLAGTRPIAEHDRPWDTKNVEEHDIVTRYIADTLAAVGVSCNVSDAESLSYGKIEHLCHRISGNIGDRSSFDVLNRLSPTPALAGYPLEGALRDIAAIERHPRLMYGGYVGIMDHNRLRAFVNIRCAHFDTERYCLYGGGGITSKSIPEAEWNEAAAKMSPLLNAIVAARKITDTIV